MPSDAVVIASAVRTPMGGFQGALKPLATMALAMNDGSDSPIDADKLPPVDVLTRHLTPIVYSECSTPDGYQMESVGSLTLNQAVVALAGGAAAVLGPHIQKLMKGGLSTSEPPPSVANGQRPESEPNGNRQTAPPEQKLGDTSPQPERPPDPQEPVPSKAPCDP